MQSGQNYQRCFGLIAFYTVHALGCGMRMRGDGEMGDGEMGDMEMAAELGTRNPLLGKINFGKIVSDIQNPSSHIRNPTSNIQHRTSDIPHPYFLSNSFKFSSFFFARKLFISPKCSFTRLLPNSNTLSASPSRKSLSCETNISVPS